MLCYFEGLTHEEAAERLGWPLGSVKGRLAAARGLLRKRLVRRGVGLSAGTALASIEQHARAVVPHLLQINAVRSALAISGESARALAATSAISMTVSTLAQGVIRTMIVTQIRALLIPILLGVGVVSTGASVVAFQQGSGSAQVQDKSPKASATPPKQSVPAASNTPVEKDLKTKVILKKLELPVAMDFPNKTPLGDFLKYIQRATSSEGYSGIPIYVDPVGLQEAEKSLQSPITIRLDGVPLNTTLRLVLNQLDLAYHVDDGYLKIDYAHDGPGRLLAQLADEVARADKDPRTKAILKKLELPVPMDFENETLFEFILKYIQSATADATYSGIPIYIDPLGLVEVKKTLQSPISVKEEGVPLKTTLRRILEQLGLVYCVHDGFVMITSPRRMYEELDMARAELGIPRSDMPLSQDGSATGSKRND